MLFIKQNDPCNFNNDKMQLQMLLFTQSRQVGLALPITKLKENKEEIYTFL